MKGALLLVTELSHLDFRLMFHLREKSLKIVLLSHLWISPLLAPIKKLLPNHPKISPLSCNLHIGIQSQNLLSFILPPLQFRLLFPRKLFPLPFIPQLCMEIHLKVHLLWSRSYRYYQRKLRHQTLRVKLGCSFHIYQNLQSQHTKHSCLYRIRTIPNRWMTCPSYESQIYNLDKLRLDYPSTRG